MGHKNYSSFSNPFKKTEIPVNEVVEENNETVNETVELAITEPVVTEIVQTPDNGVVNCERLNVRKRPSKDAEVLCVINKNDKIKLLNEQNEEFIKICTASGIEGYCMKKFINVK